MKHRARRRWAMMAFAIPLLVGCGLAAGPSHTVKHGTKKAVSDVKHTGKKVDKKALKTLKSTKTTVTKKTGGAKPSSTTKKNSGAVKAPSPMGSVTAGAKLYTSSCQVCHGKAGMGTSSGPRLARPSAVATQFKTEASLVAFIAHNMPATKPGSLSPSQASDAGAYVWSIGK